MNRVVACMLTALVGFSVIGCQAGYTSIRKVDDGHYVITRTKQGFFKTYGTVYACTPKGDLAMECVEIDSL